MKVVILCGGKGTRLREETEYKPKPMVKVGDMPLLWHIMKIYAHHGYKDFILCLGYKGEMIKDYFLRFEELSNDFTLRLRGRDNKVIHHEPHKLEDWNITFADTGRSTLTGGRIARIKKYIADDEDFLLTYGDGLGDVDINKVYDHHKEKNKILTVTAVRYPTTFGIMDVKEGHAKDFAEKPPFEGWVSGGFYVCNRKIFDYLKGDASVFEKDAMQKLSQEGQMAAYEHNGFWYAVNTHKEWEEINQMEEQGNTPWKVWKKK